MWLNSKKAAEILGIKYGTIVKSINRASKKGKKFCSIKSNILNFKYIIGVGGNSGKTLQIWIDDEKRTDKDPISGKKADNSQICNGQIISQGYKADEIPQEVSASSQDNKTDTRTATHTDKIYTRSAMQGNETDTHLTTHADEICARATMQGNETDTRTTTRADKIYTRATMQCHETDTRATTRVTTQADEMNKCAKIHADEIYNRTATHVEEMNKCAKIHINETKSNHKTIKDLENMQKLKAIHDFNNRPCGMGKTL